AAATTANNVAVDRLATDLNVALAAAGLGDVIIVQAEGTKLRFVAIDPTVQGFTIQKASGQNPGFDELFATEATTFDTFHETTPHQGTLKVGSGIISADAVLQFTIKRAGVDATTQVTLDHTATTDNVAVGDDTIKLVRADNSATFDSVQGLI